MPHWLSHRLSLTANDAWSAGIAWLLAFSSFGFELTRGWVLWDLAVHGLAVYAFMQGARTRWALVLALPVGIAALWSADNDATMAAGLRVASLCILGAFLIKRWSARGFAIGAVGAFAIQAWPLPWQMFDGREEGLAPTISRLGTVGLGAWLIAMAAPQRWVRFAGMAVAMLTIAASGARAPMIAAAAAVVLTSWKRVGMVALAGVLFIAVTASQKGIDHRLTTQQLRTDAEMRLATTGLNHDPAIMELVCVTPRIVYGHGYQCSTSPLLPFGTGAHSYMAANPWPRPHNIYAMAVHEMGVLVIVPVIVLVWAIRTGRIPWRLAVVLGIYGLLDDSMLSPNGYYVLALVLLPGLAEYARREVKRSPPAGESLL